MLSVSDWESSLSKLSKVYMSLGSSRVLERACVSLTKNLCLADQDNEMNHVSRPFVDKVTACHAKL